MHKTVDRILPRTAPCHPGENGDLKDVRDGVEYHRIPAFASMAAIFGFTAPFWVVGIAHVRERIMDMVALLALGLAGLILVGSVCGIAALLRMNGMQRELAAVQRRLRDLEGVRSSEMAAPLSATPLPPQVVPQARLDEGGHESAPPALKPAAGSGPAPLPPRERTNLQTTMDDAAPAMSLEMRLGSRWIIWLGALFFLGGVGLGLKYAYDSNLIGPAGRLMIGVLAGVAALGAGEYYRRRAWLIPFQALTGGGLAIFYLCIFFSFQLYHLTGQEVSSVLALCVTALAVLLSTAHNAMPIAMLAVVGGYLSPILLSTGQNQPWMLFGYIAALNLTALGAAWFRRWRMLDSFCLVCTALLYIAWYDRYYAFPDQTAPALFFAALFYFMFMLAPTLYTLVRGVPEGLQCLTIIIANSLFWLFVYYSILYSHYPRMLGLAAFLQAAFVFALYQAWTRRVDRPTPTAQALLMIALALLTLVIPLQLRLYGIPIGWAVEGVLFIWLGLRFRNPLCRFGGLAALYLAAGGLFYRLPLHALPFTPLFNRPFGAWICVVLCALVALRLASRHWLAKDPARPVFIGALAALALVMTCLLLTMETFLYWRLDGRENWMGNMTASLTVLWTLIPLFLSRMALKRRLAPVTAVALAGQAIGILVFLACLEGFWEQEGLLLLNLFFLSRALFAVNLFYVSQEMIRILAPPESLEYPHPSWMAWAPAALEWAGHGTLALLAFFEMVRWGENTLLISKDMAIGLVSALWALHACILIWRGLRMQCPHRRYIGFLLFGAAAGKTALIDVFNLAAVYRIASWLGVGLLLVLAALLYQQYAARPAPQQEAPRERKQDDE